MVCDQLQHSVDGDGGRLARRLRSPAKGSPTPCFGAFDELSPEIVFRSESVVSRATQREIRGRVLAALGEWLEVVKF
jgi:hypothetical protein